MAIDAEAFQLLLLHARLLPELALARMAQDVLDAPRDGAAGAIVLGTEDGDVAPPGDAVDWFGGAGLSEAELRELRESAERELAAFDAAPPAASGAARMAPDAAPGAAPGPGLDLAHELALAYAQRDALAPLAAAASARIDAARLEALLAATAGAAAPLTEMQDVDDLELWLMLVQDGEPAVAELLRTVQDAAEGA